MQTDYLNFTDQERLDFLKQYYIIECNSFGKIAERCNARPSTLKKDAKKFGIKTRDKSEAQSNALKQTGHHPTRGKKRPDSVKSQISEGMYKDWQENRNRERQSKLGKAAWDRLSKKKKKEIQTKAFTAIREASKSGSKLEHWLHKALIQEGYRVLFHCEKILGQTKLQVDLLVEDLGVAIEVNGPHHRVNIWQNEEEFTRVLNADKTKRYLLNSYGFVLIVVNQTHKLSQKRKNIILTNVLNTLSLVKAADRSIMFYKVNDEE